MEKHAFKKWCNFLKLLAKKEQQHAIIAKVKNTLLLVWKKIIKNISESYCQREEKTCMNVIKKMFETFAKI